MSLSDRCRRDQSYHPIDLFFRQGSSVFQVCRNGRWFSATSNLIRPGTSLDFNNISHVNSSRCNPMMLHSTFSDRFSNFRPTPALSPFLSRILFVTSSTNNTTILLFTFQMRLLSCLNSFIHLLPC